MKVKWVRCTYTKSMQMKHCAILKNRLMRFVDFKSMQIKTNTGITCDGVEIHEVKHCVW